MYELKRALEGSGYSAPGQDQLCYVMFRHLPEESLKMILLLFNKIWSEGVMPISWKSALILPFPKPGKDPANAGNYRPIALTSHLCKWMEKIIVYRLSYFLEQRGLMNRYQSGFRKGRSTADALVKVSNESEKALSRKEVMVIVYFDIEKAYDSMWREGLLIKMQGMGIGGRLYNWVLDFLSYRKFCVKVGDTISDSFDIINGIPQGSAVSPILFNIMINDIFVDVGRNIGSSLYADDGAIWLRGKNYKQLMSSMQKNIIKVENWSYKWGFKMSIAKSCYMLFTRKRKMEEVQLKLYGQNMEKVSEFKYLGVWFDEKGLWRNHVNKIETKCKKILNLMRAVSAIEWGADRESLLCLYRALIRSCIDYGCMIYGAAAKSSLEKLDRIQSRALRISIGAVKTTPINAMLVEANELPLYLRRIKLAMAFWVKLKGSGEEIPAVNVLENCWEYSQIKKNRCRGFGWVINEIAEKYGVNELKIGPSIVWGSVPPWVFPIPDVDLSIMDKKREWNEEDMGNLTEVYIKRHFYNYLFIFTDGSKNPRNYHVGIGVVIPEFKVYISKRISDRLSVFTAEVVAIIFALQWVDEIKPERVVICSDSIAALKSLHSKITVRDDLIMEILMILLRIERNGTSVQFCWVPAHCGVKGNEEADKTAKLALEMKDEEIIQVAYGRGEVRAIIRQAVRETWQREWDNDSKGRQLYKIQKSINVKPFQGKCRKEEVVMARLRLGHTGLRSTLFIMAKSESPMCEECGILEDVDHIIFWCRKYSNERTVLLDRLYELERPFSIEGVLGYCDKRRECARALFIFLKDTGVINKI